MKPIIIITLLIGSFHLSAQTLDTAFFPQFVPHAQSPVIEYGDEILGVPWNDPVVLKENGQYIMYCSGVEGGLNHPDDTISIYRWISNDGYDWTLNPTSPVLEADSGTYYGGGVETPSVVFYKGEYHMYNTVYKVNNAFLFKISHATSPDGIAWSIDPTIVLEPAPSNVWMDLIVAEPGVMVKDDTLYLFFSAASSLGGFSIGLVRSIDGVNFIDTTQTAQLPTDVYQNGNNYQGLSTPSPVLIGSTIHLFTDVAQNVFGSNWKQVALHQFKSYGDINKWYHDTIPIHTRSDFPWTDGNYSAEILGVTPLLDENRLRIWYSGNNISSIDTTGPTNDTTYNAHFVGPELHADSGYWAIGTSEYIYSVPTAKAGPDTSMCEGDSITLVASGGDDYLWNNGLGNAATQTVSPMVTTIYTVTVTLENGFSDIDSVQVTINPTPDTPSVTISAGQLISSASTGNQWRLSGDNIANATGETHTPVQNGIYSVLVTSTFGCFVVSDTISFVLEDVGVDELNKNTVFVYPNPISDVVNLKFDLSAKKQVSVRVFDVVGKEFLNEKWKDIDKNKIALDMTEYPQGLYFLELTIDNEIEIRKLVKK